MSVMDPDPDAEFNLIVAGLDFEEPKDVIDYTQCSDAALSKHFNNVRSRLHELGALQELNPIGEAADLQSKLYAINAELQRRFKKG